MLNRTANRCPNSRGGLLAQAMISVLLAVSAAHAVDPPQKCQSDKNKAAGKYASCRQNAEAKLATSGDTAKYNTAIGKCETKFNDTWGKTEAKAAGTCHDGAPTAPQFKQVIDAHTTTVAYALAGNGPLAAATDSSIPPSNATRIT